MFPDYLMDYGQADAGSLAPLGGEEETEYLAHFVRWYAAAVIAD